MIRKIIYLTVISMLLITKTVFAQNAQELNVGSTLSGNLGPGQEIWYSVRTNEAGILTVETTGSTDTYMEAYDAQRNLITEDDDSGDYLNARIEFAVTAGNTYFFKVRGYDAMESGPYRIFADIRPLPVAADLRVGSFLSENLTQGGESWFSVRAPQNGILVVETISDIDTFMEAYDENFVFITYDDDSGEGYNARIEIVVAAGRAYLFKVRGYDARESGPYRIIANQRSIPTPVQLTEGTFRAGNIVSGEENWYSVRTTRSGLLIVETTGSTDTYMYAYSESFILLDSDDDSGEGYNARIEILAEANHTYTFRLRGYSTGTSGPYRIFAIIE
jgi:hypothetical protein